MRSAAQASSSGGIQDDNGDLAVGVGLVVCESRIVPLLLGPNRIALSAGDGAGAESARFSADFRGDVARRDQVVVPIGMVRRAGLGREDGNAAVPEVLVHHGINSFPAAASADGVQQ